ncbi:hypothetical protein FRC17_009282 [Serendipita sp. 399]|nr:hypothetical protein FRC17_009282 [Serendipita sp. 399]
MSGRGIGMTTVRGQAHISGSRGSWRRRNSNKAHKVDHGEEGNKMGDTAVTAEDPKGRKSGQTKRAFPTHFLSLPLVKAFTDGLLATDPPIPGLDKSIVIKPARLHITLGVMQLRKMSNKASSTGEFSNRPVAEETSPSLELEAPTKTIDDALALLASLRQDIMALITGDSRSSTTSNATLMVPMEVIGVLQSDRNLMAQVLWIGPRKNEEKTILDLVNHTFRKEGFITEKRPLNLHCTILNTSKRRGAGRRRIPFSGNGVFESEACMSITSQTSPTPQTLDDEMREKRRRTTPPEYGVDFGTWSVNEIQLCEMGSRDRTTGAYVSVGSIKLTEE